MRLRNTHERNSKIICKIKIIILINIYTYLFFFYYRMTLTVIIVAIIENARNALSFLTASSRSWFGSVLSKVFLISTYVIHKRIVPPIR